MKIKPIIQIRVRTTITGAVDITVVVAIIVVDMETIDKMEILDLVLRRLRPQRRNFLPILCYYINIAQYCIQFVPTHLIKQCILPYFHEELSKLYG